MPRAAAAIRLAAGLLAAVLAAVLALPALAAAPSPARFADNPIVYFVITDRFVNGDPSNDGAYGRTREADPAADVGSFHGGDLKGLRSKLEAGWFDALGVNALWITAPYEQIHGWVVGGRQAFRHYAYHGYWALDFTRLDASMGTPEDLRALVAAAHARGIRVLFDVVMNHPGYLDITTAAQLGLPVLWPNARENATLDNYHRQIDYNSFSFDQWWGRDWVRAGLPGYLDGGRDERTKLLAYLPDFRTESTAAVDLPPLLRLHKPDTAAVPLAGTTVRGYLVQWLTAWVRDYGIDGFRCDTVMHVEPEAWAELKREGLRALADWKARHAAQAIDDAPFWMTGEYWGHGPERGPLHDAGFDAMINFDFQREALAVADNAARDALFARYAALQAGRPAQMLNYLSSHDTLLFPRDRLVDAGSTLLLAPGGVQVFYGDETARPAGPAPAGDAQQATRSDMNWAGADAAVLAHWQRLGSFRARHVALARGTHRRVSESPYVFERHDAASDDRVVVALDVAPGARLPVGEAFAAAPALVDAYTGRRLAVRDGHVTVDAAAPAVLLEPLSRR